MVNPACAVIAALAAITRRVSREKRTTIRPIGQMAGMYRLTLCGNWSALPRGGVQIGHRFSGSKTKLRTTTIVLYLTPL